ncbi:MAG: hypothetical protein GY920_17665 [Aliivibrio sp.]|nr:hypothetical protein [Aliivibrio sp.]
MAYKQSPGRMNMPKTGRDIPMNMVNPAKHTGKKVKVTTTSGKEIELDTRSSEYKALKARKTKKGDKDTTNVFDKGDIHYAGLKRK